jgi:hypothetical protein
MAEPSSQLYWHIGETAIRFGRVTAPRVIGSSKRLAALIVIPSIPSPRRAPQFARAPAPHQLNRQPGPGQAKGHCDEGRASADRVTAAAERVQGEADRVQGEADRGRADEGRGVADKAEQRECGAAACRIGRGNGAGGRRGCWPGSPSARPAPRQQPATARRGGGAAARGSRCGGG